MCIILWAMLGTCLHIYLDNLCMITLLMNHPIVNVSVSIYSNLNQLTKKCVYPEWWIIIGLTVCVSVCVHSHKTNSWSFKPRHMCDYLSPNQRV